MTDRAALTPAAAGRRLRPRGPPGRAAPGPPPSESGVVRHISVVISLRDADLYHAGPFKSSGAAVGGSGNDRWYPGVGEFCVNLFRADGGKRWMLNYPCPVTNPGGESFVKSLAGAHGGAATVTGAGVRLHGLGDLRWTKQTGEMLLHNWAGVLSVPLKRAPGGGTGDVVPVDPRHAARLERRGNTVGVLAKARKVARVARFDGLESKDRGGLWVGVGINGGVGVGYGGNILLAALANYETGARIGLRVVEERMILGGGASAALNLVVVTGGDCAQRLTGKQSTGWGLMFAVGADWKNAAKGAAKGRSFAPLLESVSEEMANITKHLFTREKNQLGGSRTSPASSPAGPAT